METLVTVAGNGSIWGVINSVIIDQCGRGRNSRCLSSCGRSASQLGCWSSTQLLAYTQSSFGTRCTGKRRIRQICAVSQRESPGPGAQVLTDDGRLREVQLAAEAAAAALAADAEERLQLQKQTNLRQGNNKQAIIDAEARFLVQTYSRHPLVFERGDGCKLYDTEGKEYLDLAAGIAVNSLGHGDSQWLKDLHEQAAKLVHVGNHYHTVPQVRLAERLVNSSFADRVFFANSGTEANEGVHLVGFGDLEATAKVVRRGRTAAVFVEPTQGDGGVNTATAGFLRGLRRLCDEAGALLVFDEVQCGLGRTGLLWAHQAYGVVPDMMTLAKPLAGGLPIGAVLVTEAVASAIAPGDHGSTFAGGPLVCQAALAVMDRIQTPGFLEHVAAKGGLLRTRLREKMGSHPRVRDSRRGPAGRRGAGCAGSAAGGGGAGSRAACLDSRER